MIVDNQKDLEGLLRAGKVAALTLKKMVESVRPGITTLELDRIGEAEMNSYGARSAPRLDYNFPGATCICVNEQVAHGIPGERVIQPGDMVNIDVSLALDGYYADNGYTVLVDPVADEKRRLCDCCQEALKAAINAARAGHRISEIGRAVEHTARNAGYGVIKNLFGHGVGRGLHEEPQGVASYFIRNDRRLLEEGMVIAIEPFISSKGEEEVIGDASNGWTLYTPKKSLVVQYEHTVVVTKNEPIIITAL